MQFRSWYSRVNDFNFGKSFQRINLISSLIFISLHASHQFIYLNALYVQSLCNLTLDIRNLKISILIKVYRITFIQFCQGLFAYLDNIYIEIHSKMFIYFMFFVWPCKKAHQKLESRWLILRQKRKSWLSGQQLHAK